MTQEEKAKAYDDFMDEECIDLCNKLNSLSDVETTESCCGHCRSPYMIFFNCYDFIRLGKLFRCVNRNYSDGKSVFRWKRNCNGEENTLWANAPMRVLYLTKDQNSYGDVAWDVRSESFRYRDENYKPDEMWLDTSVTFYRNLVYSLYGILKTTIDQPMGYNDFTDKDALTFVDKQIFARINCTE